MNFLLRGSFALAPRVCAVGMHRALAPLRRDNVPLLALLSTHALAGPSRAPSMLRHAAAFATKPLVDQPAKKATAVDASTFDFGKLSSTTQAALKSQGIEALFPIQEHTLAHAIAGKDVVGRAFTGTGKTLAYLLPIVERKDFLSAKRERGRAPRVLVLVPTRELALQVQGEITKFLRGVVSVPVYGGAPYEQQLTQIERGVDIVVGTPGRIQDLIDRDMLNLSEIKYLVLDEADTMLNRGFKDAIETMMLRVPEPKNRQTLLFSATMPEWVGEMTQKMMINPVSVDLIGSKTSSSPTTLTHIAVQIPGRGSDLDTERALVDILHVYGRDKRIIVFAATKTSCQRVVDSKLLAPFGVRSLHGDMSQALREMTMDGFRKGQYRVLVATDVAARGLDIPEVDVVVQLNAPVNFEKEMFVHRAGRAGRAGRPGVSIVLYNARERREIDELERFANVQFERQSLPTSSEVVIGAAEWTVSSLSAVDSNVTDLLKPIAEKALEQHGWKAMAAALAKLSGFTSISSSRSLLSGVSTHTAVLLESPVLFGRLAWAKYLTSTGRGVDFGRLVPLDRTNKSGGVIVDVPNDMLEPFLRKIASDEEKEITATTPMTLPPVDARDSIERLSQFVYDMSRQKDRGFGGGADRGADRARNGGGRFDVGRDFDSGRSFDRSRGAESRSRSAGPRDRFGGDSSSGSRRDGDRRSSYSRESSDGGAPRNNAGGRRRFSEADQF